MKVLLLLCTLVAGLESAKAQTTFTKWKQVQDPSELATNDVVVIVDLTTSSAMRNNPKYDEGKTVSNEAPASVKVTLKEELIVSPARLLTPSSGRQTARMASMRSW